jgi:hypothetical protein
MSLTFAQTVNPPAPASETVAPLDFSKLFPDYAQGVQFGQQQRVLNAFAGQPGSPNGIPTTDGTPNGPLDFQAMYRKLMSFGAYDQANQVLQSGLAQQGVKNTSDFNSFIRTGEMPGQSQSTSPAANAGSGAVANNAPGPQSDYYSINHQLESGGSPTSHNSDLGPPGTAAYGLAGFMPQTWAHLVQAHPELNLPADITKSTAAQQQAASQALTGENAGYLAQNGVPVTDRTARMANFLGSAGAVHFFNALAQNGASPAASIFPKEAAANPDSFYLPDGKTPRTLAQLLQYETVTLPLEKGLAPFGSGNTTGFNYQPSPRNQVAGPGAPSGATAYAATGEPIATNAQGQAIDPRTGLPTQAVPTGRPAVRITNQPTGSAVMTAPDGTSMAIPANRNPAVGALSTALAARAAQDGGTAPGGAATATGGAAAANAARVAAAQTPGGGGFGQIGPPGPPGNGIQAPVQIAQGGASAPVSPSDRPGYAENLAAPPPSNPMGRAPGGAAPATAPSAQSAGTAPSLTAGSSIDPTLGGIVPKTFADGLIARGVDPSQIPGTWARYLTSMASSPGISKESADSYRAAAQQVMETLRQANVPNAALKEYQATRQIDPSTGQPETQAAWKARTAGAVAAAEQQARNDNTLVETQPIPGGPKQYDTAAHIIRSINNGTAGANSSVGPGAGSPPGGGGVPSDLPVASQPAFIADRQKQIAGDENTMMQQFQARQVAKQRLGELGNLVEEYQTGAAAEFKADAQAYAKAWGIDIPNSATTNAALFQEIQKNAIANIFSNAKDLGGRILVSELAGLAKSNVNAELQPAATAKIISQQAGLLNYEDAHTSAYFGWKHANPNAYDTSGFEIPWIKSNPVRGFTDAASKEIAPLGAPLPPAPERQVGQVYQSPNGLGVGRWTGIPGREWQMESRPAAQRLFPSGGQ